MAARLSLKRKKSSVPVGETQRRLRAKRSAPTDSPTVMDPIIEPDTSETGVRLSRTATNDKTQPEDICTQVVEDIEVVKITATEPSHAVNGDTPPPLAVRLGIASDAGACSNEASSISPCAASAIQKIELSNSLPITCEAAKENCSDTCNSTRPSNGCTSSGCKNTGAAYPVMNSPLRCPICTKAFDAEEDSPARAAHVNSHFGSPSVTETSDVQLIRSPTEQSSQLKSCHLCEKDLSHMNETRRTQHINQCLDGLEKSSKHDEMSSATIAEKCPMCSRTLSLTRSARTSHLKRCAKRNNVNPAQLITLLKGQLAHVEVEEPWHPAALRNQDLIKLSDDDDAQFKSEYRNTRRKVSTVAVNRQRVSKRPKSKHDEELQLAMALSASIDPDGDVKTKKHVGRLTKAQKELRKPVPPLLVTTAEELDEHLQQRVAQVICAATPVGGSSPSNTQSPNRSLRPSNLVKAVESPRSIWNTLACREKSTSGAYVVRGITVSRSSDTHEDGASLCDDSANRMVNSTHIASQSSPYKIISSLWESDSIGTSLNVPEVVSKKEAIYAEESQNQLPDHLLQLVDSPIGSDLKLVGSDGDVQAHKCLLFSRCPHAFGNDGILAAVLDSRPEESSVALHQSRAAILAVLRFVYTGKTRFAQGLKEEVSTLASILGLKTLSAAMQNTRSRAVSTRSVTPSKTSRTDTDPEEFSGQSVWDVLNSPSSLEVESPLVVAGSSPVTTGTSRQTEKTETQTQTRSVEKNAAATIPTIPTVSICRSIASVHQTAKSKGPQTQHERVVNAIKEDDDIYLKVLHYIPLNIETLLEKLNSNGIPSTLAELVAILNSESVTYIDHAANKKRNRNVKRRHKKR